MRSCSLFPVQVKVASNFAAKPIMINVAIAGLGYWGPHLVRNFNACRRTNQDPIAICEQSICEAFELSGVHFVRG